MHGLTFAKPFKRNYGTALLAAVVITSSGGLASDAKADVSNKIKTSGTIVLGYRTDALPFSYRNDQGKPSGYAVELCEAAVSIMQKELGMKQLKVVWREVSNKNRFSEIEQGNIDLECSNSTNTIQRHKLVSFGPTYFIDKTTLAVRKNSKIKNANQLDGQTIAVTEKTTHLSELRLYQQASGITFKISTQPSFAESIETVISGKAAGVALDQLMLTSLNDQQAKKDSLQPLGQIIGTEAYAAVLKRDDQEYQQLVNKAFEALMIKGTALAIYDKWFTQPIPGTTINFNYPITEELKALFTVQRPHAKTHISHIEIMSNPFSSGEDLIQAYFQMESLTGQELGTIATTQQQTAAIKALVEPYLDSSVIVQRANGRRYNKKTFIPAYIDRFTISDVNITKPSQDLIVVRYNIQAQQILPDSATVMNVEESPRLTVFRWDPIMWKWQIVSHANFNTPLAAICNYKPVKQTPLDTDTSAEDTQLGIRLFERYLKYLRAKNLKPVVDPEVQFQSASGRGGTLFKESPSVIGTFQGTTYKDVVVTRNGGILNLSLSVKHKLGIYQGAVEIKNDYNPILWTFRKDAKNDWKLISAATFAPAKNLPSGSKCISEWKKQP